MSKLVDPETLRPALFSTHSEDWDVITCNGCWRSARKPDRVPHDPRCIVAVALDEPCGGPLRMDGTFDVRTL